MHRPVSLIMHRIMVTVNMDDTLEDVEALMKSHRVSSVPVYDMDGAIVGIVTVTDLLKFQGIYKAPKDVKAWEICTYKPIEVTPGTSIKTVAELMISLQIHHVIVMDNESLQGIVSSLDFVKFFMERSQPS